MVRGAEEAAMEKIFYQILSQQWLWGIIIGAGLTYLIQQRQNALQQEDKRRIASMQVATLLRFWLSDCSDAALDHQNWEGNNDEMGKILSNIPALNAEQSLDQIVHLKTAEAKAVFELMHKTKRIERNYAFMRDIDGEDATENLLKNCGALFEGGLKIYNTLARNVGWNEPPVSEHTIQRMADLCGR